MGAARQSGSAPRCALGPGKGGARRRKGALLLGAVLVSLLLAGWQRPWADMAFSASVSLRTDRGGVGAVRHVSGLFAGRGDARPVAVLELELGWAPDQLVLLEVRGEARRRRGGREPMGYVACAAEVVSPEGVTPLELGGWHPRAEMPFPTGPIGLQAYEAAEQGDRRLCYSRKGPVWHVFPAPSRGLVRVYLRPVLYEDIEGRPRPALPPAARRAQRAAPVRREAADGGRPPDIFIYLVDAARADHLGCYGYQRDTSPNVDEFAAHAVVYEQARATATWTRPSVASVLTGLYPSVHGAVDESDVLPSWPTLLSEALGEAGYVSWCVTTNPNIDEPFGFNQGYDEFICESGEDGRWADEQIARLLAHSEAERPVFLFAHIMEPHPPYLPSRDSLARFDRGGAGRYAGWEEVLRALASEDPETAARAVQHLVDRYDGEIFEADRAFGEFLDMLRRSGRLERALVVFLADHGQSFREHGALWHGHTLAAQELRVPLIVRYPGRRSAGVRVRRRVSLADVFAVVLAEAGVGPEGSRPGPGRELRPKAGLDPEDSRIHCQLSPLRPELPVLLGVIDEDGYKRVIAACEPGRRESKRLGLWDTNSDPREERNLVESMPVRAAYGEQLIACWLAEMLARRESAPSEPARTVEPSGQMRRELRALGYLR